MIPESVQFHLLGLSDRDANIPRPKDLNFESENVWKMATLSSIQKSLKHSKVLRCFSHQKKCNTILVTDTCTLLPFYFSLSSLFIKISKLHPALTLNKLQIICAEATSGYR